MNLCGKICQTIKLNTMYKFRAIPVLEGRAAEHFLKVQEMLANQKPNFDVKAEYAAFKRMMERSKAEK